MASTLFVELRFWLLMVCSVIAPMCIYFVLLRTRSVSRVAVLMFGFALVVLAGIDVYLLQGLARLARLNTDIADDALFIREVSVGLYVLPVLFGGIGVNMISHVLVSHLEEAEEQFDRERVSKRSGPGLRGRRSGWPGSR